jgi:uncharacterized protein (DUF433 family)
MATNPIPLNVPLPDILEEVDGTYRVKGTRIGLFDIVTAYNERWIGPQGMVHHYPTVSVYEVEKVLEFYRANAAAVDDWVRRWKAEGERIMAALPRGPSKAELLARLAAREREKLAASGEG